MPTLPPFAFTNFAMALTASASMPRKPCCDFASQGSDCGGAPPSSSTTSTLLALVSRLLSFGASAAGVTLQPSLLCDRISAGAVTCCSAMLATPSGWLPAIFQSGLARVIVDDSTRPSTPLAAMAPSAAENVPMLVPTSQTGALACCLR